MGTAPGKLPRVSRGAPSRGGFVFVAGGEGMGGHGATPMLGNVLEVELRGHKGSYKTGMFLKSLGRVGAAPTATSPPSLRRCRDMSGDMRALLCLWLVAQVAQVALSSGVRTRRELGPGLYQHGVYDAGGSYCQRGDVCCHGRDDGCTVPYHDTLCYCDLFCNRTVSDCCPDFWEYCLGIPAPFPKASGEECPARLWGLGGGPEVLDVLCDAAGAFWGEGCGIPRSCPRCRAALDPARLWELLQSVPGWGWTPRK